MSDTHLLWRGACSLEDLGVFLLILILFRSSAGSVGIIWVALVASLGHCLQWHKACCPAKKWKTGQTIKDRCCLSNEKTFFLVLCNILVWMQQKEAVVPSEWMWTILTQAICGVLHLRRLPSLQRGQHCLWALYWRGALLALLEQVTFTPWKQPVVQLNASLCWAGQHKKDPW